MFNISWSKHVLKQKTTSLNFGCVGFQSDLVFLGAFFFFFLSLSRFKRSEMYIKSSMIQLRLMSPGVHAEFFCCRGPQMQGWYEVVCSHCLSCLTSLVYFLFSFSLVGKSIIKE